MKRIKLTIIILVTIMITSCSTTTRKYKTIEHFYGGMTVDPWTKIDIVSLERGFKIGDTTYKTFDRYTIIIDTLQ